MCILASAWPPHKRPLRLWVNGPGSWRPGNSLLGFGSSINGEQRAEQSRHRLNDRYRLVAGLANDLAGQIDADRRTQDRDQCFQAWNGLLSRIMALSVTSSFLATAQTAILALPERSLMRR